jgi:hypothetical protein
MAVGGHVASKLLATLSPRTVAVIGLSLSVAGSLSCHKPAARHTTPRICSPACWCSASASASPSSPRVRRVSDRRKPHYCGGSSQRLRAGARRRGCNRRPRRSNRVRDHAKDPRGRQRWNAHAPLTPPCCTHLPADRSPGGWQRRCQRPAALCLRRTGSKPDDRRRCTVGTAAATRPHGPVARECRCASR